MKIFRIIFLIFFSTLIIASAMCFKTPESDILKAFVSSNSIKEKSYISKLASLANTKVNIIFEAENEDTLEELKNSFLESFPNAQKNNFAQFKEAIEVYQNYPINFLSEKTRNLLKNKEYKTIENLSFERLYNPLGIYIASPDKDPYLFATDFLIKNAEELSSDTIEYSNKIYSLLHYEITEKNDVKNIIKSADVCNEKYNGHIYLTGVPIHSYYSAVRSGIEVNIICTIATVVFVLICLHYFRTTRILFPIVLSIIFGLLCGFCVTVICFKQVHVLTFVFSTSLIGISLDYSLHYILSDKNSAFKKSLLLSLVSTILAFVLLFFSNIQVLKQISIFTIFGLLGVYIFVHKILPLFKIKNIDINFEDIPVKKHSKWILSLIFAVVCYGLVNLNFSDDLKTLYQPKGKMLEAEIVYNKAFNVPKVGFILTKGSSLDEIIEQEEIITKEFNEKGIKYIALSDYISSTNKQKENLLLVKELYNTDLRHYAKFLDKKLLNNLLKQNFETIYNPNNFILKNKFEIDENTTFILVENPPQELNVINIQDEMKEVIKTFRKNCLKLIPLIFAGIFVILSFFMPMKKSLRLILPSLLGGLFPIGILTIFNNSINVFHLLAFILVIGFSLDYSIFRANCYDKNSHSNLAVFISAISSTISFALLSFAGFKVISSLGIVLSLGIFTSYILSLILLDTKIK